MQFYHHPYSLDSQKVRLALEEKGIDYTSYHVNPITGKNMDTTFFRRNQSGKLPVIQNGSIVIYDTIDIIQYIERIAIVSTSSNISPSSVEVVDWMNKIQEWNPKFFTLFHVPEKYRVMVSKFLRRVLIARMAECPDLASSYHCKLREEYHTEEKLRNLEILRQSEEQLVRLLDEVETKLNGSSYLVGEEFSMADVMLIPLLAWLKLLNLEAEYIKSRMNVAQYWNMVQRRPSYKKVIGKYFNGWRKYKTLFKTWCSLRIRDILKRY